jgi:preprotein translocase subunit SecA
MDDGNITFPMATAEDVRKAFRDGAREDFISGRAHNVYGVNRQWGEWAESWDRDNVVDKGETGPAVSPPATLVSAKKVGRNDPCPCGSGKKYKKRHGR